MPNEPLSQDELLRRALFVPCHSKQQLHRWIELFLGLDMPDCIVDPDSNSSPMDLIWEIYTTGMKLGKMPFSRMMAYASRDSFKTLGASILEVLSIVHMRRSVAHMAAIEPQAQKAVQYVKDFLNRPFLREFVVADNKRNIEIRRYFDRLSGISITPKAWHSLKTEQERNRYEEIKNYLQVVICTPRGANSAHVPFFVVDEVDLAEPKAYEEAKMIPAPYQGRQPITLLTSTRKISYGLVQKEIDKQLDKRTGRRVLEVRHWNVIDVTESCPASRHQPEKPKIPIHYSLKTLQAMRTKDFELLASDERKEFKTKEGYEGCLNSCTLFAVCQGRLATDQKSKSTLLKPIDHVIQLFSDVSINTAQAQLMCWKPSTEGLVYPNFDRATHMLRAFEIAAKITGEVYPETFSKSDLIALMKSRDITFHAGMDFGFTHNFAVVTAGLDGGNVYVIDVIAVPGLEQEQQIEISKQKILPLDVSIYADSAYPAVIKSFSKAGFRIKGVEKNKGSVVGGIEIVRAKLLPARGKPQLFLLAGDAGCDILAQRMGQYHWKQDTGGNMTDIPDEKEDDECFTGDTEILTGEGWKRLDKITGVEQVLAVTSTGESQWEVPQRVIRKQYTGSMFRVKHSHLEFEATVDHPHAVMNQTDWKINKTIKLQARTIEEYDSEMFWLNNPKWQAGDGFFVSPEEAWIAGFWIAEGCFDSNRPSYLLIDQTKKQHQNSLRQKLTSLGWHWSETNSQNGHIRFVISGQKERASKWRELFGSTAALKTLPIPVLNSMSDSERRELWDGYMCGDGSRTTTGWHFDSTSKSLIESVQILTMMIGYGCRIVSYDCMREGREFVAPNGKRYLASKIYRGHVLRKLPVAHIKKDRFEQFYVENTPVYCVTTSTAFFLARNNGKPFVAKNCDSIRYLCMSLFAPKGRFLNPALTKEEQPESNQKGSQYTNNNWMRKQIQEHTGDDSSTGTTEEPSAPGGKRGAFSWSFG